MELIFLGTSAMVPTKERNHQSIYLDLGKEAILLDCGEGTQRQIQFAKLTPNKIKKILISHWHGDHVAGLIGLFQTIGSFAEEDRNIKLYGPKGSKKYVEHLFQSAAFDKKLDVEVIELNSEELKTFYENQDYKLQFINLEHSIPTIGFKFVRKSKIKISKLKLDKLGIKEGPILKELQNGNDITYQNKKIKVDDVASRIPEKSISFVFDTKLCDACFEIAKDSEYLISEAVYEKDMEDKAEQYKHMTCTQAAQIASMSNVKKLILTHFSQRYKTTEQLEQQAKDIFPETTCAYDLMKVKINF
ncbi:MAG: ribonuclease Z [Candidatus Woesearchaeota archaeon]